MKVVLLALILSSCAHMEQDLMYYADTAGSYECDPVISSKATIEASFKYDPAEFEKYTGYSQCLTQSDADSFVIECQKPTAYKRISAKKQASCHKFLADNKVMITR